MRTVLTRSGGQIDLIRLANRLVLKTPPTAEISLARAPNLIKSLHLNLQENLGSIVQLPDLRDAEFVGIFSDYGGDEPDSGYLTYSFLITALDGVDSTLARLEEVRSKHGLLSPRREMAFKNLEYGPLMRALPDWMSRGDELRGLLFTLLVDKRSKSVITQDSKEAIEAMIAEATTAGVPVPQKRDTFERYYRIASCVAYWTSLLCREGQQVIWISDNDSSAANPKLMVSLRERVMSLAADLRPGLKVTFSYGAESDVPPTADGFRELLSFPDLAAGALAHGMSRAILRGAPGPGEHLPKRPKAREILRWLAWQRIGLKKSIFLCQPEGRGLIGAFGSLEVDDIPDDVQFVPITSE